MQQLIKTGTALNYAPASIRNYHREVRFFLAFIPEVPPVEIKTQHVIDYFYFLRTEYNVTWRKVHMSAQSIRFLFVRVFQKPLAIPKSIYPRKEYTLPSVMSRQEVQQLFSGCLKKKGRLMLQLIYSSGLRLAEMINLSPYDIDSKNLRIKVRSSGKQQNEKVENFFFRLACCNRSIAGIFFSSCMS